ncbi:MAG: glycine--tRNA ligase [Chlamydiae bacterium SM23_39]|nr:MAG: glycine--tRNA ligase [Chlamydiae bacterium SM23_39]
MKNIVSLCKRRGFIYPGSEIYGGFANTYSYGPYGVELKKNIKDLWWQIFVREKENIVGIDGPILLHPKTWEASGHVKCFTDALIDCKKCKNRFRADQLIEKILNIKSESLNLKSISSIIKENKIKCPNCNASDFTEARHFNLMFQIEMSKTDNQNEIAYLRPETAQAIFLEYKNILDSMRIKIPFGIAQIGKAFRNEITPGNFIFRTIEFEQMEIEYFIKEKEWKKTFEYWLEEMLNWCKEIGLNSNKIETHEHKKEELSHYSKKTVDIIFDFPFGKSELYGLAYRTDFDLKQHAQYSKSKQEYIDQETKEKFIPHVIEPTFGLDRTILAILSNSFEEETLENGEKRTILHLSPKIAPVKAAVFPLMKKQELISKSLKIYENIKKRWNTEYDENGAIGKRYRRQDEIGTPFCITIDYETLENDTVTIRERDTMKQKRVKIDYIKNNLENFLKIF